MTPEIRRLLDQMREPAQNRTRMWMMHVAEWIEKELEAALLALPAPQDSPEIRRLLEEAFEAGHFAWPTIDTPTRALMRTAAVDRLMAQLYQPAGSPPFEAPAPETTEIPPLVDESA